MFTMVVRHSHLNQSTFAMETKQTAVDWLFLMLNNQNRNSKFAKKLYYKAKEIEKEQIIDAAHHGVDFENSPYKDAEEYYNETYKS